MEINLRRLKAERVLKGLSQQKMSELCGFPSRAAYAKREIGAVKISAEELATISNILEVGNMNIFFTNGVPEKELKKGE